MINGLESGAEWLRGHGFTPCLGTDGRDGWEKTDGDVRLFAWWNAGGVWFCTASTPRCLAVKTAELVECAISHALLEVGRDEEMVRSNEEERAIANAGLALGVAALSDALGGGAGEAFLSMRTEMPERTPLPDDLESTFRVPDELDEWEKGTAKENG